MSDQSDEQEKNKKAYVSAMDALGINDKEFDLSDEKQQLDEIDTETGKLQQEFEHTKDQLMRALAEIENVRRIAKRDIGNAHKYALKPFIESLLPVMDSLEQGMVAAAEHGPVLEGLNLTYKMMLDILKKHGVEQIDPMGKEFDPEHHEAMSVQENGDAKPNTVLAVVQKGYILHGRVVRAARVIVAKR